MKAIDAVQAEIKALGAYGDFGTKKEIKSLPEILHDDEKICALTSGLMNGNTWLIVCTNKRVIFLDKGMIYGLKQVEIPLEKINSILQKTGIFFGEVHIWDGASKMEIRNCIKRTVKPFVDAVNKATEEKKNKGVTAQVERVDVVSQLEKLATLLEAGLLTKEEFEQQKKKILGM